MEQSCRVSGCFINVGVKLCRRVLTCCWDSMLTVLSAPLKEPSLSTKGSRKVSAMLLLSNEAAKDAIRRDAVVCSLDALQRAATLGNILGMSQGLCCLNILDFETKNCAVYFIVFIKRFDNGN